MFYALCKVFERPVVVELNDRYTEVAARWWDAPTPELALREWIEFWGYTPALPNIMAMEVMGYLIDGWGMVMFPAFDTPEYRGMLERVWL